MTTIPIFIGFDSRERESWMVAAYSIMRHASMPVTITPLMKEQLPLHRVRHPLQSTEFSFTRFLVPSLCHFQGWAIFMDCDILVRDDITKLWRERDPKYVVQVVDPQYVPKNDTKKLGQPQSSYERKLWSAVMIMNNVKCGRRGLDVDYVQRASGLELHQFKWIPNQHEIGFLPSRWQHVPGYHAYRDDAALVHFTEHQPNQLGYENLDYADEWRQCRHEMLYTLQA